MRVGVRTPFACDARLVVLAISDAAEIAPDLQATQQ